MRALSYARHHQPFPKPILEPRQEPFRDPYALPFVPQCIGLVEQTQRQHHD